MFLLHQGVKFPLRNSDFMAHVRGQGTTQLRMLTFK